MSKKYNFSPVDSVNEQTVQGAVAEERPSKRQHALSMASAIWTLICTLYSVVSVCSFVIKGWVDTTFSRVLIVALAVYVVIFIVLVVLTLRSPEKLKKDVKAYKKTLGVFKAFVNVVYLVISAISMAALARGETTLVQWIVFGATLLVASVQLALKIATLIFKLVRRAIGKRFKVEVQRFSNGERTRKRLQDGIDEKTYK